MLYTTTPVEDLDEWQGVAVGLTESVELQGLERLAEYAVVVAARTRDGLGRLSPPLTVRVRPTEVPVNLRATDVSTHGLTLSWGPAIHTNPLHYRVRPCPYSPARHSSSILPSSSPCAPTLQASLLHAFRGVYRPIASVG